ncbi:MBL fold metallo-hydrolase [Niallia sp. MER 6]|uniref:MBL fold metallo-hydrolase n=1 Tax=Niallia sp. MER 6 TaxID=2939567 RepID=UPI0020424F23|nr:MBL fold metallo-hydrolase [Niallia sp. MER 6]MCM3033837.1 MBL fold metallo-hydrolase [Niallia sp. MER 6]
MEPFVYFKSERISDSVTRIFGPAGEIMYLVEGSEKAALIDTGTGVGDLKAFIESLTDKPYFVLLTHGHVDHAMGAPVFNNVYMNPADKEIYAMHSDFSVRKGFLEMNMGEMFARVKEEDYIHIGSSERYKSLLPGDIFNLGGINLEICVGAGHTPGLVTILIVEERTLLLGDACNFFTFLFDEFSLGITSYQNILRELNERTTGRYDKVYLSHGSGDAPREMLDSILALCEDIKAGTTDDVPFVFMEHKAFIAKEVDENMRRLDGGLGNIVYSKDKVHK